MIGDKIIKTIERIKEEGANFRTSNHEHGDAYSLDTVQYRLEIVVDPKKWLGLEFCLKSSLQTPLLSYQINTDLYDIANPKYRDFAHAIERNIVTFLESLEDGLIKQGKVDDKLSMIIPDERGLILIKKGRFFTTKKHIKDMNSVAFEGESLHF